MSNRRVYVLAALASVVSVVTAVGAELLAQNTLPMELYRSEHWKGGSREAELLQFVDDARRVGLAQLRVYGNPERRASNQGVKRRLFHAKSHGCLTGRLVLTDEPHRLQADPQGRTLRGLFAPGAEYRVIGRFSNGVGWTQPDQERDVRGLALKIVGVRDPQTGQEINVDFLMTNNTNPFGRDQSEFVDFMDASVDGGLRMAGFLLSHPTVASRLITGTKPIESLATTRFWGGHAYLLGQDDAMKFNVSPLNGHDLPSLSEVACRRDPDYLKRDLTLKAFSGELQYAFNIQLEKDQDSTPVEDTLKEWTEEASPSIRVGTLVFDRQDLEMPRSRPEWCESLRFTPGHFHPDHRPLGNMGRGRIFTYRASQLGRLGQGAADPVTTGADLDRLGSP